MDSSIVKQSGQWAIGGTMSVDRLGYGAMRITGAGIWGDPADRPEALRVLRRAVDLGTTFIDTAESYGPYVSEDLIAEALHPYPAGLVIATKVGLDRPGPGDWRANGDPARLRAGLEGSLRRLRVDCIDLYQLHRIDPAVPAEAQFEAMAAFQREGKVRYIGLSEVSVADIVLARQFVPVVSVQNKYNLAERQWEAVVDYCERERIAFIPWYPLQVGKVGQDGGVIIDIARRLGATPSQVALAWLLRRAKAMLPIPGTGRVAHLEENIAAAALQLSDADYAALAGSGGKA